MNFDNLYWTKQRTNAFIWSMLHAVKRRWSWPTLTLSYLIFLFVILSYHLPIPRMAFVDHCLCSACSGLYHSSLSGSTFLLNEKVIQLGRKRHCYRSISRVFGVMGLKRSLQMKLMYCFFSDILDNNTSAIVLHLGKAYKKK